LVSAELGNVVAIVYFGRLLHGYDPQRFAWFGRAAANGASESFLKEMRYQIRKFWSGTGHSNVCFRNRTSIERTR
jgi:hypothetical protein